MTPTPGHQPTPTPSRPVVVLAGGSGFLGRSLADTLARDGYTPVILSRRPAPDGLTGPTRWVRWDPIRDADRPPRPALLDALRGTAGLVNLTGRSVDCRKTPANVRAIMDSRIGSCATLGAACAALADAAPPVWIQAATAHIVGDPLPLDRVCDEATPPGPPDEVAPAVGVAWERAFEANRLPTQRGVTLRISFVLGPPNPGGRGALGRLGRLTRWGLGGTVGHGRQWMSWIHQQDLNRLIILALTDPAYDGVYLTTAPEPVNNRTFMRALRRAYRRPWSPPAPALGVRLACRWLLRTDPELALLGRRCVPTRLLDAGFAFAFPTLEPALRSIVRVRSTD